MKSFITFISALLILCNLQAQQTFIASSSSTNDWNSLDTWTLENGQPATNIPTANDHVIIKDFISLQLEQTYTHKGNITVTGNGLLHINSKNEVGANFVFGGREMNIYGFLLSTTNFYQSKMANGKAGLIILHETASMNFSGDYALMGGLILESSACGASRIEGDFMMTSEDAFVCGEGNIMVTGDLRAFANNGNEIRKSDAESHISLRTCEQVRFHGDVENCASQYRVAGASQPNAFIRIENMQIEERASGVNIAWKAEATSMTQTFTVERSLDGRVFQAIATIEDIDEELFQVLDQQPVQVKSYYRIKQTLRNGYPIYSELKIYDPFANMGPTTEVKLFPNQLSSGETFHLETSRLQDVKLAKAEIKNLSGQTLETKNVSVSSNGKIYTDIQANQAPGMYLLILHIGNERVSSRFQVR